MPRVLIRTSIIFCGEAVAENPPSPPFHGGKVTVESTTKLKVKGESVLLKSNVETGIVADCKTPDSSNTQSCSKVNLVSEGEARKLTVERKRVMLDTLAGITIGNPSGNLVVKDANQNKLNAN